LPSYPELKICLDLNIWYAIFLAEKAGKRNTVRRRILAIIQDGIGSLNGNIYLVSLIMSFGMIDRLREVIKKDKKIPPEKIDNLINSILEYTRPSLTLGGTGVHPISDSEDGHILDTVIANRCHFLVTDNFKDFIEHKDIEVMEEGVLAVYKFAISESTNKFHKVYIIKPEVLINRYLSPVV
jgi:predicted nucleic acid-binding protein